ncbi:MAG: cation:proton antiporter [Gammaproteobacteria bacterium]|nr:cation:proton antiporter [Gammaproteobacteria bacterium]NIR96769.1 cation:proton antiporter [Gammaproteobacteria bacterium]NIT62474.1 cation:proton antiporter [Gammaproteobacteria bacterium]NIV19409.1 cation:proton antiporter [Gammaproteobacteria bacterium]NIX10497.1 cation:proton antiporter [Gammaproteobacteria bacterium]
MRPVSSVRWSLLAAVALCAHPAAAAVPGMQHQDPIAPVILGVTGILFFAVLGRFVARNLGQPSVLGELIMGVVLGNVGFLLGFDFIHVLREGPAIFDMVDLALAGEPLEQAAREALGREEARDILAILQGPGGAALTQVAHTVDVFSRYGVIFLLFLVGLETSLGQMREVGGESLRVAIVGVAMPFLLGFFMARLLMPELSVSVDLFVAATLGATSIGISARVLRDIGQTGCRAGRVILGAAVIDDVLGLIMLAIVTGIVVSGSIEVWDFISIVTLAGLFLVAAFVIGPYFLNFAIRLVRHLDIIEAKMFISFLFVMVLAWLANLVGLATIVGAFAAGVILHDAYFHHWGDVNEHRFWIRDLIAPLEVILVPIFFVLMGIQVKLESFLDWHVITMALGLLAAAIAGKIASGLAAGPGSKRLAIGIGMMPRGEVGLIFASIGISLGVISDELFSALVFMVIVTTLITPPLLKASLLAAQSKDGEASRPG